MQRTRAFEPWGGPQTLLGILSPQSLANETWAEQAGMRIQRAKFLWWTTIDSAIIVNAFVNTPSAPFAHHVSVLGCILFYCRVNSLTEEQFEK